MRTPKEYTKNLNNGIITEDMFAECLYSVNKRAKNCRDNARAAREKYRRNADTTKDDEKKAEYYRKKEFFLQFLKPVAIHQEKFTKHKREQICDYDEKYQQYKNQFIQEGYYFDTDLQEDVEYGIIAYDETNYRYYLYYEVGDCSFHSPVDYGVYKRYPDLPEKTLLSLVTEGQDTKDLLSMDFVNKVMLLLCSGKYDLQVENRADPLPIITEIPDFVRIPKERQVYKPQRSDYTTIYGYYDREITPYEYVCRFSVKTAALAEAEKLGMKVTTKSTMKEALEYIDKHGDILDFASRSGVGVEKTEYIKSGMSNNEYKRLSKKMKVVGTRTSGGQWKNKINQYDIKQYLKWRNTGIIE